MMARLPRVSTRAREASRDPLGWRERLTVFVGHSTNNAHSRVRMAMDEPGETVLVTIGSKKKLPSGGSRTRHELIADWSATSPVP